MHFVKQSTFDLFQVAREQPHSSRVDYLRDILPAARTIKRRYKG